MKIAEKQAELVNNLQKAVKKKNPESMAKALNEIEKRLAPEKIQPKEKELIDKAKLQMNRIEKDKSIPSRKIPF